MEKKIILDIAGIRFSILDGHVQAADDFSPFYAPFLDYADTAEEKSADMIIRMVQDDIPLIADLCRKFDSPDSWSLFEDSTHYYILFHPKQLRVPLWFAQVDRKFSETTIYRPKADDCNRKSSGYHPVCYPLDQILLMNMLLNRQSALVHAACVKINDDACIFPGVSGAGKSTLSRQLLKHENIVPLSDDRTIIRRFDDHYTAYGTPWPGEEGIAENSGGRLAGIFFIVQSHASQIKKIGHKEALKLLFPTISVPWYDSKAVSGMLDICAHLIANIPAYAFHVKPGPDVADILEEALYG